MKKVIEDWEKEFRQKYRFNWSQKQGSLDEMVAFVSKVREEAKQEAVQELVERAKDRFIDPTQAQYDYYHSNMSINDLDQLAQEIMEGK